MSTLSLTSLWLICPDLVLISLFTGPGLLFMFTFGVLSAVMQSGWSSQTAYLPLASSLCLMEVILSLSPFSIHYCFSLVHMSLYVTMSFGPLLCSTGTVCMKISSSHPVAFLFVPVDTTLWLFWCCICASCSV